MSRYSDKLAARGKKDPVDSAIEQAYYRLAAGKQISIMDIPKVFADCRTAVASGQDVDSCVMAAVEKYCIKTASRFAEKVTIFNGLEG